MKNASTDGDEETDVVCEKCGSKMIRRIGKYGKYLACSNYPACSNIVSEGEAEISAMRCPKCGANMVVKSGKYGKFLACPNYPACSSILPIDAEVTNETCRDCGTVMLLKKGRYGKYIECPNCSAKRPYVSEQNKDESVHVDGVCPECGKPMRRMRSKTGKIYFGCTGYPDCKFLSWDVATGEKCPTCNSYLIKKGNKIKCSDKNCNYSVEIPENEN